MKKPTINIHAGNLLIASPLLKDPNFNRSVVLILDRDVDRGFIGLVINRQLDISLQEICDIDDHDKPIAIFNGGPVDLQRLFWLHTMGDKIAGAKEVLPGIYIGGRFDDIRRYIIDGNPVEGHLRFYLGYSGWVKGQLEKEIESGAWHLNPIADPAGILSEADDSFWNQQVKQLGPAFRHWLMLPPDPSLN